MRASSAGLQSFLISRVPCTKADLFTVTLADGTIYRWTDYDQPVTADGNTFLAQGPLLKRSSLSVKNTIEVPQLVIKLFALDTDFVGGVNIKKQLHDRVFSGSTVQLDRAFMVTPGDTSLGTPTLFAGRMGQVKITATGAELTVRGANVIMNQSVPRNVYQTSCMHAFCDLNCTLARSDFTTTNTAGVGSTKSLLKWGTGVGTPGIYTRGTITMTSGPASGQKRTIKFADGNGIILANPLYNTPNAGDSFSALKGCDKSFDSGSGQSCTDYANTQHFRAFEFVPPAETAV